MRVLIAKSSKEELSIVRKALEVSMDAHDKMRRKSGEPYILHPIEVAGSSSRRSAWSAFGHCGAFA